MKKIITLVVAVLTAFSYASAYKTLHEFKAKKINGDTLDFAELAGKKVLIVNTASECGYTYQYAGLEELYQLYKGYNFEIIGFPANNFGLQEPGNDSTIAEFCKENYGVTFTMMSKISVKGTSQHPIYKWLTSKSENGKFSSIVQWNFQKYLIGADGNLEKVIYTQTEPLDTSITNWITSGINSIDESLDNKIELFPNPSSDFISINGVNYSEKAFIYNIYGSLEMETVLSSKIDISMLKPGVYYIKTNSRVLRFIKI